MTDTIESERAHGVLLSDNAADKVRPPLSQEGRDDLRLRADLQPGGGSGLNYSHYFDARFLDSSLAVDFAGV